MPRRIKVVFPSLQEEVIATLLEEEAPLTCRAVWHALERPVVGSCRHGHDTGPELYVLMPAAAGLPDENATVFPIAGDLLFYHYDGQLLHGERIYDIGMYYDRGCSLLRIGWTPGNWFARVTENLEGLRRVAQAIHETGPKDIRVERLSGQDPS